MESEWDDEFRSTCEDFLRDELLMSDSAAALRLGATFDPNFLGRVGVRGNPGDPAQAASWYRRARDLGDAAAAERLKKLEGQPR